MPGTKPSCSTRRQNFSKLGKSTPVESVSLPKAPPVPVDTARPSQLAFQKPCTISIGVLISPARAATISCAERHSYIGSISGWQTVTVPSPVRTSLHVSR